MAAVNLFMELEVKKLLFDASQAGNDIRSFTEGCSLDDYSPDRLVRAAVERKFEIIGEALNRLTKLSPDTAGRIRNIPKP